MTVRLGNKRLNYRKAPLAFGLQTARCTKQQCGFRVAVS
jgi:hypothetical protein